MRIFKLLIFISILPWVASGGNVHLVWEAPTTNEDGSVLMDLAGYSVYYGPSTGVYDGVRDAGNVTRYTVDGLVTNQGYYVAVTAHDFSDNESVYSNEIFVVAQAAIGAETIVDNTDPGFGVIAGQFSTDAGKYGKGFYGSNYLYGVSTGWKPGTDNRAKWTPTLPEAGTYEVCTRFGSGWSNWSTNAPFTVHHADGETTVRIDQRTNNNGAWISLGTYRFEAGSAGHVVLSNDANYAYVVADAVKWVFTAATATVDPSITLTVPQPLAAGTYQFESSQGDDITLTILSPRSPGSYEFEVSE